MNDWELCIDKAFENIDTSKELYKKNRFGLAAFHAQQALEISIKSYCYKFEIIPENANKKSFKTHLPSSILFQEFFDYLLKSYNENRRKNNYSKIEGDIDQTIFLLEKIIELVKKLSIHDTGKMKQIFKVSLGIPIEESDVKRLLDSIDAYAKNGIPKKMCEEACQDLRIKAIKKLDPHYFKLIQKIKTSLEEKFEKIQLSEDFLDSFLDKKSSKWEQEIANLVTKNGAFTLLDMFYKKDGLFEELNKNMKIKTFDDDSRHFGLMGLIAGICSSVIFSFPHEQIGRYPTKIGDNNSEEIYKERKMELEKIIHDCEWGVNRIKGLIK